jgi:phosphate transport system substrate-binding protein
VDVEVARSQIECLKNLRIAKTVQVMPKSGKMAKKLAKTPGAIGMTTMVRVLQSKGKIKPLSLNGVAPSPKNMMAKKYTLTREAFVVTKEKPTPAVAKFLSFIRSEMGKKVIIQNDAVAAD